MATAARSITILVSVVLITTALVVGILMFDSEPSATGKDGPQFTDVAGQKGFNYTASKFRNTGLNGVQGVYVIDYNDDGWKDLLVTGGQPSIAVFKNVGGEFERANILPQASPAIPTSIKSVHVFDYDNDGLGDLLLLPRHGTGRLLQNVGNEFQFREDAFSPSLAMPLGATSFDYNQDGCLDLFVIQSGDWARRTPTAFNRPNATVTTDNGNPNLLFKGTCSGFERVEFGASENHWSLATSAADLTGDDWPDIHVANDYYNNVVYVNDHNGSFERRVLGTRTNRNGMSSELADVNRDGLPDLFVTNIHLSAENASSQAFRRYIEYRVGKRALGNLLLVNTGDGQFRDQAGAVGVKKGGWGWAASVTDFDNDGRLEFFHATQRLSGMHAARFQELTTPNYWDRTVNGTFRRNATMMGFTVTDGRGVATIDYDRDGDQDIAISNRDGDFRLYENRRATGNWLKIQLEGADAPTTGSVVSVTVNGTTRRMTVTARSDFLSQDTRTLHVGLGDASSVEEIKILRPDGTKQSFSDVGANQYVTITPRGLEKSRDCFVPKEIVDICQLISPRLLD
jgi:hypothetical protein